MQKIFEDKDVLVYSFSLNYQTAIGASLRELFKHLRRRNPGEQPASYYCPECGQVFATIHQTKFSVELELRQGYTEQVCGGCTALLLQLKLLEL